MAPPSLSAKGPSFVFRAAAVDEELGYLRYLAEKRAFYRANGYSPSLPDHPLFVPLGPSEEAGAAVDWQVLDAVFRASLYRPGDYEAGIRALRDEQGRLASAMAVLQTWKGAWGFDLRDAYAVVLTLYGVGGSYDVASGRILGFPTRCIGFFCIGGHPVGRRLLVRLPTAEEGVARYRFAKRFMRRCPRRCPRGVSRSNSGLKEGM
jgi:hypothetical protein